MANRAKHMARSHRSYHTAKPFADFERKASLKVTSTKRKGFFETIKSFFNRTTNK